MNKSHKRPKSKPKSARKPPVRLAREPDEIAREDALRADMEKLPGSTRFGVTEAAIYLRCTPKTIYNKSCNREITTHREYNGTVYLLKADCDAYKKAKHEVRKADVWSLKKTA